MACLFPRVISNPRFDLTRPISADNIPKISIPCGHCYHCRSNKVNEIAMKIKHERLTQRGKSCFVTLTYNNEHLPVLNCNEYGFYYEFDKTDFQLFMKRLRITIKRRNLPYRFKYFACGEYGHKHGRCHYHCILLGVSRMEIINLIKETWRNGFVYVKDCDSNASYYCTKYMKKANSSLWWSADSPKHEFDDLMRKIHDWERNGASPTHTVCDYWTIRNKFKGHPVNESFFKGVIERHFSIYKRVNVEFDDLFKPHAKVCRGCPWIAITKKLVLRVKRLVRDSFNASHLVSFSWSSLGIGKQYCLDHMDDFTKKGYFIDFDKEGNMIRRPIPRSYKDYVVRSFYPSPVDYVFHSYRDIFPNRETFLDSYNIAIQDSSFNQFVSDSPFVDFTVSCILDKWCIWNLFNLWKSWIMYDKRQCSDRNEQRHLKDFGL